MSDVTIPQSMWDKFIAPLFAKEPEVKEVVKTVEPEDYAATKQERDELKAQFEKQQADAERKTRVEKFDADLKATKADPTLAEMLADLEPEKADAIMRQLKALSEQIKEPEITGEMGQEGQPGVDDPQAQFNAIVLDIAAKQNLLYPAAFEVAKIQNKDLFVSAFKK